jgi:hypothetical protein
MGVAGVAIDVSSTKVNANDNYYHLDGQDEFRNYNLSM